MEKTPPIEEQVCDGIKLLSIEDEDLIIEDFLNSFDHPDVRAIWSKIILKQRNNDPLTKGEKRIVNFYKKAIKLIDENLN